MKVKIGDKIYDPNDEPIMLIFTRDDQWNIARAKPPAPGIEMRYCSYPDDMTPEEAEKFMFVEEIDK